MAGLMSRIAYVSDDGTTYSTRQDASNAVAVGNEPAAGEPGLPGRYKPRYILASHPTTGRERRIMVSDPNSALWLGGSAMFVQLPDFNAAMASTAFVVRGRIGERRLG